jgi:hypothetical protein
MQMRSIEDLLDSLIETTEAGKLIWEQEGDQRYVARLRRYRLDLWQRTDDSDASEVITVQLLSRSGDVLDCVSADESKLAFDDLSKLYLVARRSAFGVSKIISEVEEELLALKRAC